MKRAYIPNQSPKHGRKHLRPLNCARSNFFAVLTKKLSLLATGLATLHGLTVIRTGRGSHTLPPVLPEPWKALDSDRLYYYTSMLECDPFGMHLVEIIGEAHTC